MIRLLAVLILLAASCKPQPTPTSTEPTESRGPETAAQLETGTTPVGVPPSDKPMVIDQKTADELKLYCEQAKIDVELSGDKKSLDAESLGTEGAFAEAFTHNGQVVRIKGGKLFESQRESFDYVYRDGKLACASESRNSLHVILAEEEGWELWWHEQYVVFNKGGGIVSLSADFTSKGESRGADKDTVLASANELYAIATR